MNDLDALEIVRKYNDFQTKLTKLIKIAAWNKTNYFLYENDKEMLISKSFVNRCQKIEEICLDMKQRRPKNSFGLEHLEKRFALEYFCKIYKDIEHASFVMSMECFFVDPFLPEDEAKNLLKNIFEEKLMYTGIISMIANFESVNIINNADSEENYLIPDIQSFVKESGFQPAFLAALVMSLCDAGHQIQFYDETSFRISKISLHKKII